MSDLPNATHVAGKGQWQGAAGQVALDYEGRFLRRKRLVTTAGAGFLVDLPEVTNLTGGEAFVLEDGRFIEVTCALEPVLVITGDLPRLAWHIGNRHTPCQIEPARLVIRADHVLENMLRGLGGKVTASVEPFRPEGGAYGIGRTMGHDHGHDHGHGHSHGPGQFHVHL
ncbi:urease accessory protein UreE [Paenirhodobacter sp. CAU 1674]|jgi:urease accessory protein|uniref:urease accessory protein UreE n=1 Tax=Paenirhodobacter sp. CAU 1674 TaxID=3032596 RepID=UPI0023D9ED1E|nr:urease accessory protein UreE [Paenirhodobacter sp. CAU 1674]MDF2141688.1 urease accessory protein UreE [Paenirhodobacter sp. CAU 1674]